MICTKTVSRRTFVLKLIFCRFDLVIPCTNRKFKGPNFSGLTTPFLLHFQNGCHLEDSDSYFRDKLTGFDDICI